MRLTINKKNIIFDIVNKFFFLAVLTFGFFPILPPKLKGLPVIFLLGSAFFSFFLENRKKHPVKFLLLFSSLYIVYALSLSYSNNIAAGLKTLETTSSLIIIPFCFHTLSNRIDISKILTKVFLPVFVISSFIYGILIIAYFAYLGLYSQEKTLSYCLSYLNGMFFLSEHPIYASMYFGIAILLSIKLMSINKNFMKILLFIGILFNLYIMFMLIRKGVLIALIISVLSYFYFEKRYKFMNYKKLIIVFLGILLVTLNFKESISNRFLELVSSESYEYVNEKNSTSIRYFIYKCSLNSIKQNLFLGYGIGGEKEALKDCYSETSEHLSKLNYNSHNQYLGILLSVGLLSLLLFFMQLFIYSKSFYNNHSTLYNQILLFYVILLFSENILDRQSGVILFSFLMNYFFYINLNKKDDFTRFKQI